MDYAEHDTWYTATLDCPPAPLNSSVVPEGIKSQKLLEHGLKRTRSLRGIYCMGHCVSPSLSHAVRYADRVP